MTDKIIRPSVATLPEYALCEVDDVDSTYTYIGKENKDGYWLIQRITNSTNSIVYAAGVGSLSSVWSTRSTQTYSQFNQVFGDDS